jgi:outer membrane protein assembly factor BamB
MQKIVKIILFFIIGISSCTPDNDMPPVKPVPQEEEKSSLKERILWSTSIMKDSSFMLIKYLRMSNDKAVFVRSKGGWENTVVAVELSTGKILWEWGNPEVLSGYTITSLSIWEDKVILDQFGDIHIIDLNTGQTLWQNIVYQTGVCGDPRVGLVNDQIYYSISECGPAPKFNYMLRTPITHFQPDTIFKIAQITTPDPDSGWITGVEPPRVWMNTNGDSILIFQARSFKLGVLKDKVDLYAFNLKTRSLKWHLRDFVKEDNSSILPGVIEENRFYFCGAKSLHCIDLNNGNIIWRHEFVEFDENNFSTGPTIWNDMVILHPRAEKLYSFNKYSGNINWTIDELGLIGPESHIDILNGVATYLCAPYLVEIDCNNGKLLSKEKTPNKFRNFNNDFEVGYVVKT